jgi:UDP-glucose 4-epimerase
VRVVVVGASGNAGSALLRALHAAPEVTSVVGLSRRRPDLEAEPFRGVEWYQRDVALPAVPGVGLRDQVLIDDLAEVFSGADAVVHLAWLIQPNRQRALLRRTNVDGTRHVARAAAAAGVPHLVVASSVGAYTPVHDDVPRDEGWATGGTRTSHYSVDKAAQERVLHEVELAHPEMVVTRLRPALIFQPDAGSEIARYFLGPLVPRRLLRPGTLPLVPLPTGLRLQAVHADDAARAYLAAVLHRDSARGAFNIAHEQVLRADDLAGVLDHGRSVGVPAAALRPLVSAAYDLRLVPTDPGWLDMAMGAPLMSTDRARTLLGWEPLHTAADSLADVLHGMADRRGLRSASMQASRR